MVGIPGKSKGCHTCRRRKIRCDLQQPSCMRCVQSGRTCEGYKRGPVFLNRTAQGWEKRSRLEEALPRHDEPDEIQAASPKSSSSSDSSSSSSSTPLQMQVSSTKVMKLQFHNLFLENYLPANPSLGPGLTQMWLAEAVHLNKPGKALEYSLHALCMTRIGRLSNDQPLIVKGGVAYGHALRELQLALSSSKRAGSDDTLASCLVLSIYELFESTTNSTQGHENHISGIERLVAWRGPGQHESPLAKALLKNVVYTSMVKSIQYRKTSLLKDLVDKVEWWDMQGKLFAKGHTFGALLEDLDRFRNSGQADLAAAAQFLQRSCKLDTDFESWHRQLVAESPSPMYWKTSTPGKEILVSFASLYHAHLMLDFWALQLALSTTIDIICSQVPATVPAAMRSFIDRLVVLHGMARQVELGTTIMESLSFCMNDEYGLASSQKCLFSGRVALFALRRHAVDNLASYEAKFLELTVTKGLQYAQNISQDMRSAWTASDLSEHGQDQREPNDTD